MFEIYQTKYELLDFAAPDTLLNSFIGDPESESACSIRQCNLLVQR
jgi:hypothetical protein